MAKRNREVEGEESTGGAEESAPIEEDDDSIPRPIARVSPGDSGASQALTEKLAALLSAQYPDELEWEILKVGGNNTVVVHGSKLGARKVHSE